MNGKKNQNEQLKMRSGDVHEDFEDVDEEVESIRVASNISRGGSNKGEVVQKYQGKKARWIIFHP